MPEVAPEILVATAGPITAKRAGRNADGLITVGAPLEKIDGLFAKFAEGAREAGKDPDTMPKVLQLHMSWAETDEQALANAMTEWPNGGMKFPKADIRSPFDFEQMAKLVRPEDFDGRMVISADPDEHRAYIQKFVDLGFDRIYLHNVGPQPARVDRGLRPRRAAQARALTMAGTAHRARSGSPGIGEIATGRRPSPGSSAAALDFGRARRRSPTGTSSRSPARSSPRRRGAWSPRPTASRRSPTRPSGWSPAASTRAA